MKLAVIPARGGSKRIPRKNIKNFHGKPMIGWSIEAAIKSDCFDRIIVSTDDEEVASIATQLGAEVPFIRPTELSDDYTGTIPVIAHAIEEIAAITRNIEYVCCIYATAPFIEANYIKKGLQQLIDNDIDYSFSITSYAFPIQRAIKLSKEKSVSMFQPELFNVRSQDLEEAYHDAGQFYWGKTEAWLEKKPFFTSNSKGIILPRYKVQDIDTPEDWSKAELMFSLINKVDS